MNILWIEDFGGGLNTGSATLNLMFQDLISFDKWNEDELSLLSRPNDLEKYFKENTALHCVFLCRNYFDYVDFKTNNELSRKVDSVIIDIRLDNKVDFNLPIPSGSHAKEKFHEEAGFYIFNDLVHLGFPAESICFMTGEKNSFSGFKKQCDEIYIPEVVGFEKSDVEYGKLRQWIKEQKSDYVNLRRGVIEGCYSLTRLLEDDSNIQFRDFIKIENTQPTIEMPTIELNNYLDVLSQLLALKEPDDKNIQYRLFLRTLVHEWEENIDAKSLKEKHGNDLSKVRDIFTFAWIMKMTRNWVAHANLLEPLTPQFIAFLFLINMRAMFRLPKAIQSHERFLLDLISLSPVANINVKSVEHEMGYAERIVDESLGALRIEAKKYSDKAKQEVEKHFGEKINDIYRRATGNPDAERYAFQQFLLQYFWINQKQQVRRLVANSDEFLPTLARHIYKSSFPEA